VEEKEEENNGMKKENHIRKMKGRKRTKMTIYENRRERTEIENFMNTKYEVKGNPREIVPLQAIKSYRESGSYLHPFLNSALD
jgi:hypothetical protein